MSLHLKTVFERNVGRARVKTSKEERAAPTTMASTRDWPTVALWLSAFLAERKNGLL